ncbi:extracellular alkaline serine protease [Fusarium globosum]|uniref:Extracellular alkaline serine protease n=1 Tax=Fusarium globosum TaxID=78864 RepID=A0A8H5YLI7_9HYPO|nr:extracellular alkaline serine protease [Fusarium globosum]
MARDLNSPIHGVGGVELIKDFEKYLTKAENVVPVFSCSLDTSCLLRGELDLLQRSLPKLSDPQTVSTLRNLEKINFRKLNNRLLALLDHLDELIQHSLLEKLILQLGIVIEKGQDHISSHPNVDALVSILAQYRPSEPTNIPAGSETSGKESEISATSVIIRSPEWDQLRTIMLSSELLRKSIERIWPTSRADDKDLISTEDDIEEKADDIAEISENVENANSACARLEQVFRLLSEHLRSCKGSRKHVAKLLLSGLGGFDIRFLISKCETSNCARELSSDWHPVPCTLDCDDVGRPPFDGCNDFVRARLREKEVILIFKGQKIFREFIDSVPNRAQDYTTVPDFMSLEEILNSPYQNPATITHINTNSTESGWFKKWFLTNVSSAGTFDHKSALRSHVAIVQYLLSESVFHLYNSRWLLDPWAPRNIEFPRDSMRIDFKKPYCPSFLLFEEANKSGLNEGSSDDYYKQAEDFMAKFGLLLLQIHQQQALSLNSEEERESLGPLMALSRYFADVSGNESLMKEVITRCMDFRDELYRLTGSEMSNKSNDFKFRFAFYKFILMPLRANLQMNYPRFALEMQSHSMWNSASHRSSKADSNAFSRESLRAGKKYGTILGTVLTPTAIGETMAERPCPAVSTWFKDFEEMSDFLRFVRNAKTVQEAETVYNKSCVKVAVLDSGLHASRRRGPRITYKDYVKDPNENNSDCQHGTDSVDLIMKACSRVQLYVAKVFKGNQADTNTASNMAKAIEWAITEKVDIISISAGFKDAFSELKTQVENATAGGNGPEILVFAAASNWQNSKGGVAFPARMTDRVIPVFSCNGGMKSSRDWNPNPMSNATNFAMLGEDVVLDSGRKLPGGTSVSTALLAGLAAKLIDFSRQPDILPLIPQAGRDKMKTKAGMSAILKVMSADSVSEGYQCIIPWYILPAGCENKAFDDVGRVQVRHQICTLLNKAMEKA